MGKIQSYTNGVIALATRLLGTNDDPTLNTTENYTVSALKDFLGAQRLVDAPANASDTGTAGWIAIDANYIYICTATNTWKRVAIASW